jgi:uncharacterized protein (DUF1697 family)
MVSIHIQQPVGTNASPYELFRRTRDGRIESARVTTFVALLRGINVGKAKRLAMADLRALVEEAGYTQVRTLLNSGNVVFAGAPTAPEKIAARLEKAIVARVGFSSHVVVLDARAIDTVVKENTLTQADNPSRLMVAFVQDSDRLHGVHELMGVDWGAEAVVVGAQAAYVWAPSSVLESPAFGDRAEDPRDDARVGADRVRRPSAGGLPTSGRYTAGSAGRNSVRITSAAR